MPGGSPPCLAKGAGSSAPNTRKVPKKDAGKFFIPEREGVSFLKEGPGSRGPWVGKTELCGVGRGGGGGGGCRRNGQRGGGSDRDKKEGMRSALTVKKGLTDGMHSKWVPIRRMAWQAFLQPPNLEPQERRRLFGAA